MMDIAEGSDPSVALQNLRSSRRSFNANDLIVTLTCLSLLSLGISKYVEPLRYVQYLVAPIAFIIWLTIGKRKWHAHSAKYLAAALLISLSVALAAIFTDQRDFRIVAFLLLPLSTGIVIGHISDRNMTWLCVSFVIAALTYNSPKSGTGEYSINFLYSSSIAESELTFSLAVLFLAMISVRQWRRVFFGSLLLIIMMKRIALGGLLLSSMIGFLSSPPWLSKLLTQRSHTAAIVATALFAAFGAVSFNLNAIALQIFLNFQQLFDTVERITLGRYKLAETMQAYMASAGTVATELLGFGPGSSRSVIGEAYFHSSDFNVLNDYLLVKFEYGWLGLAAFFSAYALAIAQSRWGLILCAFQAIVFMTDNTLIYAFHTQVVVLCSIFLASRERQGLV